MPSSRPKPSDVAEAAEKVVSSYRGIGKNHNHPCSFIILGGGVYHTNIRGACHADIQGSWLHGATTIITSFPAKRELDYWWFEFMKHRMYTKWSAHINLLHTEAGVPYIILSDLNKVPAQVVFNMCMATRVINEHSDRLNNWRALCEAGLDPAFSFFVSHTSVDPTSKTMLDDTIYGISQNCNHYPLDHTASIQQFCKSGPAPADYMYSDDPLACTPCNVMWGFSKDLKALEGKSIRSFWNLWKDKIA